ncbi:MAG: HNH endonuclease signature motif containing protein, partial [Dermatophilaceae bacterium]
PGVAAPGVAAPGVAAPEMVVTGVVVTGVMADLALVLSAACPGGLSGVSSEQALQVVEAVEAVKAWADSVSIDATAAMVAVFETDFVHLAPQTPTMRGWQLFIRHCRSAAAREIQVATGLPITQCQRRVWLAACEPERVGPVREAMRAGRVSLARAMTLAEATAHLDGFTAATITTRVLRPFTGPDGVPLPGVAPLSEATFRARLHTQLVLHHGLVGEAERTYEQAVRGRRVTAEPQRDGTGMMLITGDGPRIAAAQGRVDTIARRLRKGGDARTIAQLRADVAIDLLLRGWIPTDPTFAQLGRPPAAAVQLIVSLPTMMGLDRGVGQIPGWGCVSGLQTRQLALQLGSIFKRVVTDPLTGRAIEVTAGTYKVPAGMAEQIKARDGTCRAPGCEIPAERCDLDHSIEWEPDDGGGPTAETNLGALHRGHHNLKTSGFWDSDQSPDGTLRWTTATGRSVTTHPYVYEHPDHLPVRTSNLEGRYGRRLAEVLNPDIPLPGHLNIFEEIAWAQALAPATPTQRQHQWPLTRAVGTQRPSQDRPAVTVAPADEAPPPF